MRFFAALLFFCARTLLADYSHCQPIVIHHALVSNSDQPNYVLTISDTDLGLADPAHGGYVQSPSGYDIVFSSDALGRNLLTWDSPEVYNSATGQLVVHVQVSTVSHASDTTLYRCAGNAAINHFQGGTAGAIWPAAYVGVYHMADATRSNTLDATVNGHNGVNTGITAAPGIIGGAANFVNSPDRIALAANASWPGTSPFTISLWIKPAVLTGYSGLMRFSGIYNELALYLTGNQLSAYLGQPLVTADATLAVNTWYAITLVSNGANLGASLYVNGALSGTGTVFGQPLGTSLGGFIGSDSHNQFNGSIDEVRILNSVVSADRIVTDYNNQLAPPAFYTPGSWVAAATATGGMSRVLLF